jgi:hypothetical protein
MGVDNIHWRADTFLNINMADRLSLITGMTLRLQKSIF